MSVPPMLSSAAPNTNKPMTTASQSSVSCARSVSGSDALIAMSDIPIPQKDQDGGLETLHFRGQDEGAGLPCRGLEKKSDVRPAQLAANVSFLPTKRGNLGQFFPR